jgi:hypothetical protein
VLGVGERICKKNEEKAAQEGWMDAHFLRVWEEASKKEAIDSSSRERQSLSSNSDEKLTMSF